MSQTQARYETDLIGGRYQVQSVLGHARAQTTKDIYAPEPNVPQILQWEEAIQEAGHVDHD